MPILLLVIKRIKKDEPRFGPWRMGAMGLYVNIFAMIFLLLTTFFSFFPPELPVDATNMNYSCVVFGGAVIFGLLYYVIWARKVYTGPIVELEIGDR